MKSITKKAYGKINLILKVGKKRDDGKHEVLTVMQKVGVFDTVTICETAENGISIECSVPSLANADNIAYKAAKSYFEAASLVPSIKISIEKRIPVTAGMAGGSTDAGAVLTVLEETYGALGSDGIYKIAASLGSDVPFFIYDDVAMLGKGSGDVLTPFPSFTFELYGLFVTDITEKPSTGEMYRMLDETKGDTACDLSEREIELKKAIDGNSFTAALSCLCNDFELCNGHFSAISEELKSRGAVKTLLCGSGPTVCGFFTDEKTAKAAAESLPYGNFVCKLIP